MSILSEKRGGTRRANFIGAAAALLPIAGKVVDGITSSGDSKGASGAKQPAAKSDNLVGQLLAGGGDILQSSGDKLIISIPKDAATAKPAASQEPPAEPKEEKKGGIGGMIKGLLGSL